MAKTYTKAQITTWAKSLRQLPRPELESTLRQYHRVIDTKEMTKSDLAWAIIRATVGQKGIDVAMGY